MTKYTETKTTIKLNLVEVISMLRKAGILPNDNLGTIKFYSDQFQESLVVEHTQIVVEK